MENVRCSKTRSILTVSILAILKNTLQQQIPSFPPAHLLFRNSPPPQIFILTSPQPTNPTYRPSIPHFPAPSTYFFPPLLSLAAASAASRRFFSRIRSGSGVPSDCGGDGNSSSAFPRALFLDLGSALLVLLDLDPALVLVVLAVVVVFL